MWHHGRSPLSVSAFQSLLQHLSRCVVKSVPSENRDDWRSSWGCGGSPEMDASTHFRGLACRSLGSDLGDLVVVRSAEPAGTKPNGTNGTHPTLSAARKPLSRPSAGSTSLSVLVYHRGMRDASSLDDSLWRIPKSGSSLLSPQTVVSGPKQSTFSPGSLSSMCSG